MTKFTTVAVAKFLEGSWTQREIAAVRKFISENLPTTGKVRIKGASQEANLYNMRECIVEMRNLLLDKGLSNQKWGSRYKYYEVLKSMEKLDNELEEVVF